jgi:hypothetical protein
MSHPPLAPLRGRMNGAESPSGFLIYQWWRIVKRRAQWRQPPRPPLSPLTLRISGKIYPSLLSQVESARFQAPAGLARIAAARLVVVMDVQCGFGSGLALRLNWERCCWRRRGPLSIISTSAAACGGGRPRRFFLHVDRHRIRALAATLKGRRHGSPKATRLGVTLVGTG